MLTLLILAALGVGVAGFAAGRALQNRQLRLTAPQPPRCRREFCPAWQHMDCGSGYCAEHHMLYCRAACTPAICKHCQQPWAQHAPPKCLFTSTTYEKT